jgi:hypothetical protein
MGLELMFIIIATVQHILALLRILLVMKSHAQLTELFLGKIAKVSLELMYTQMAIAVSIQQQLK